MVYNALKLFMEINPEFFEEVQNNYKTQRREYVHILLPPVHRPLTYWQGARKSRRTL